MPIVRRPHRAKSLAGGPSGGTAVGGSRPFGVHWRRKSGMWRAPHDGAARTALTEVRGRVDGQRREGGPRQAALPLTPGV